MKAFEGKTALVTGASRGLGQAIAVELGRQGAKVIATARTQGGLEETDDRIVEAGGEPATLLALDLKDTAPLANLPGQLVSRFGGLDILVGCAAFLGELSPAAHSKMKTFDDVMAVNLRANLALIQALDGLLRKAEGGRAMFMTCEQATKAKAFWGAYGASKAALEHMVMSWSLEVKQTPLRVNLFDPGPMPTELRKAAMPGEDPLSLPPVDEIAEVVVAALADETMKNGARLALKAEG